MRTAGSFVRIDRPTAVRRSGGVARLTGRLAAVPYLQPVGRLAGHRQSIRNHPTRRSKMNTTTTGLTTISLVCVPTPDQDTAVAFYESLGFEKRTDQPCGCGSRWIEVSPPEGATGIALAPPPPDGGPVQPTNTGITLTTSDIDATHAEMKELGVDVDAQVSRMGEPVPPMFWFRDPTGHTLMVVES